MTFSRFWTVLVLCCGAVASVRCASGGGYDSESHFLCAHDSDCSAMGSDVRCIARRCVPASTSSLRSTPQDSGRDAPGAGLSPLIALADNGSEFDFVHVDPRTGTATLRVAMPEVKSVVLGVSAFDAAAGRWFAVAGFGDAGSEQLVSIDARTGAILSAPSVDPNVGVVALGASGLVGLENTAVTGTFAFGAVDEDTGVFTERSTIQELGLTLGGARVDETSGVLYLAGTKDPGSTNLMAVDVATGSIVHDVPTDVPLAAIEVDSTGRVLAFVFTAGRNELVAVDPATGATSHVASLPGVRGTYTGQSAIDREAGIVYQAVSVSQDVDGLLAVDLASGAVTVGPLLVSLSGFVVCSSCRAN